LSYEFLRFHELELGFCYEKTLYSVQIMFLKFIWECSSENAPLLSLSRVYSASLTHTLGCYQSCKTGSDVIDPAASLFCARLSSFEDVRVIAPGLSLNVIRERVRTGGILFHEGIERICFLVEGLPSSFKMY